MLLERLTYLNIHTPEFPGGEIRGQLIPVLTNNTAPTVACPPASTVECSSPAQLTAQVSDPDGDTLTVVWIQAKDASGNLSLPKVVTVTVPHNR